MAGSDHESEDDADLRRAIALSLSEAGPSSAANAIDLTSDDDDSELQRAMAFSLEQPCPDPKVSSDALQSDDDEDDLERQPTYRYPPKSSEASQRILVSDRTKVETTNAQKTQAQTTTQQGGMGVFGLGGFDRKRMEEERLSRLASKRKAPDSEQEAQSRQTRSRIELESDVSRSTAPNTILTQTTESITPSAATTSLGSSASSLPFPHGVVRKTWAHGYPRVGDDVKIEEIFQKNDLQLAVLSSFQWDEEWLLRKIDFRKTKLILVAYAASKEQEEEMKANVPSRNIRFCFPPMLPMGNMHSKLQLLKYAKYMRIVVPTGNLMPYDWGETGVMENMVFIIDLPLIEDPTTRAMNKLTRFGEELAFFLQAQGLDTGLVNSLEKYNFAETGRYAFVHTIGKSHVDDTWKRTGYCGLGRAVTELTLASSGLIELDYVVSSLGAVNNDLITALYYAAQGDQGLKEYNERTTKRGKKNTPKSDQNLGGGIVDHFRIYFPSNETVTRSRGGKQAAGTICAQRKWWHSDTFPRHLVHDCQNVRAGLLLHSKIMLVRSRASRESPAHAWAYIGSANLSESAWGRLTKDRQTKQPKLTCRNWECGVLITALSPSSDSRMTTSPAATATTCNDLSVFQDTLSVPISWPSEAYGRNSTKAPWFFLEES